MQINIRDNSVEIQGYVNAVERKSKKLSTRIGDFVERIKKGAFKRAINNNNDIRLLLNHKWERQLAGTKAGTLKLVEDNIGLRAWAKITDEEVVKKARQGDLIGWSFGFDDIKVEKHEEEGEIVRDVEDLILYEVSILDRTKIPAYDGNSISVRADDKTFYAGAERIAEIEVRDYAENEIDYSEYEKTIEKLKENKNA